MAFPVADIIFFGGKRSLFRLLYAILCFRRMGIVKWSPSKPQWGKIFCEFKDLIYTGEFLLKIT